jgi:hypothetical protein
MKIREGCPKGLSVSRRIWLREFIIMISLKLCFSKGETTLTLAIAERVVIF